MDTLTAQPLNGEFEAAMQPDDSPKGPYFDETLNYLDAQFTRTESELGATVKRIRKLVADAEQLEREKAHVQKLLMEEWRERRPYNPETGEVIDAPFAEDE